MPNMPTSGEGNVTPPAAHAALIPTSATRKDAMPPASISAVLTPLPWGEGCAAARGAAAPSATASGRLVAARRAGCRGICRALALTAKPPTNVFGRHRRGAAEGRSLPWLQGPARHERRCAPAATPDLALLASAAPAPAPAASCTSPTRSAERAAPKAARRSIYLSGRPRLR